MEQSEKIDDDKLKQVADALGVTEDGLKKFTEETVLYSTNNFYENCHVSASNIGPITHVENLNHFSMEQAVKLFEELLKIEREKNTNYTALTALTSVYIRIIRARNVLLYNKV